MGIVNAGSQFFSFAFHAPTKGAEFNKLNRDILRPGVYKGMNLSFSGNTVFVSEGKILINCSFNGQDNLAMKVEFATIFSYDTVLPSEFGQNEILYIEYEYGEVLENYADFKRQSVSSWLLSPNPNAVILGELIFDGSNNIIGIDYTRKTWGMVNADVEYAIPDAVYYHSVDNNLKKWKWDGSLLPNGNRTVQIPNFTESSAKLIVTNSTNTTQIENNLNVANELTVDKFKGRVPLGGVIGVVGTFTSADNGGTVITPPGIPSSGVMSNDGFQICDGTAVASGSTLTGYVPKIDDDRFIQGSSSLGLVGGNVSNSFTLTTNEMPSHAHGANTGLESNDHVHNVNITGSVSQPYINGGSNVPSTGPYVLASNTYDGVYRAASIQFGVSVVGNTGGVNANHYHSIPYEGNGAAFDIRPQYISAIYLIRVK